MNVATFDKLAYVDSLKSGGVSEEQARVHANALDAALRDAVATKADVAMAHADVEQAIARLRADMEKLETSLRADMEKLETSLRSDMEKLATSLRDDMEKRDASLRGEIAARIAEAKADGFKVLVTLLLGQAALITALVKLL